MPDFTSACHVLPDCIIVKWVLSQISRGDSFHCVGDINTSPVLEGGAPCANSFLSYIPMNPQYHQFLSIIAAFLSRGDSDTMSFNKQIEGQRGFVLYIHYW